MIIETFRIPTTNQPCCCSRKRHRTKVGVLVTIVRAMTHTAVKRDFVHHSMFEIIYSLNSLVTILEIDKSVASLALLLLIKKRVNLERRIELGAVLYIM
jgi:hypothetical protein